MAHGIEKHLIYKKDKWNMMTVEENGKALILREISDQWGEECHTFLSRPEMMHWVERRFPEGSDEFEVEELEQIVAAFRNI